MDYVFSRPMRLSLMLFLLTSHCVFAQWSNDPNVNTPISTASGDQQVPAIVNDNARGAIIAWHDTRNTTLRDIYAQRVNHSGFVQWTANGVPIAIGGFRMHEFPKMTIDGTGGAIITWSESPPQPNLNYDVYAQRINTTGAIQWPSGGIPICALPGHQGPYTIVPDSTGGAFILWGDSRRTAFSDIYIQRVNSLGQAQWDSNGIPVFTLYTPVGPFAAMTSDGGGGVIITWHDMRNLNDINIYAQRVDASGTTRWTANGVLVCNHPAHQREPKIISDNAGGAIITWGDDRNTPGADYVFAQRINSSGVRQWVTDGVRIPGLGASSHSIVADGTGGAIIAGISQSGVRAHRISAEGILLWDSIGVALSTEPINYNTVIVGDNAGGAIVAWLDTRNDSTHNITDIYAQRVNASGTVMWQTNGVPITTAPGNQFNPGITTDGAGGAIITWTDWRSATHADIYAQQVSVNGILGQVTSVNERETLPRSFALFQNYPNPFNPSTTIEFELPRSSIARLAVFNVLGQEVATLVSRQLAPGRYRETFNTINLSSGVYFYKLQTSESSIMKKMLLLR
jgi:hypothetical protein